MLLKWRTQQGISDKMKQFDNMYFPFPNGMPDSVTASKQMTVKRSIAILYGRFNLNIRIHRRIKEICDNMYIGIKTKIN